MVHAARNGFFYTLDRINVSFIAGKQYVDQLNWTPGLDPKTGKPARSKRTFGSTRRTSPARWRLPVISSSSATSTARSAPMMRGRSRNCGVSMSAPASMPPLSAMPKTASSMSPRSQALRALLSGLES